MLEQNITVVVDNSPVTSVITYLGVVLIITTAFLRQFELHQEFREMCPQTVDKPERDMIRLDFQAGIQKTS